MAVPFKQGPGFAYGWTYAEHQFGYAWFESDADGKGRVTFRFTNEKMWDGDSFKAGFTLKDVAGKVLFAHEITAGVNPRSARQDTIPVVMTPKQWASVRFVTIYFSRYDKRDDRANWDAVFKVLEKLIDEAKSDEQSADKT